MPEIFTYTHSFIICHSNKDSYNSEKVLCDVCIRVCLKRYQFHQFNSVISSAIEMYAEKMGRREVDSLFPKIRYPDPEKNQDHCREKKFYVGICITDPNQFTSSQIKLYLFCLLKAFQNNLITTVPVFGEEAKNIEREEGLALPFVMKHYNGSVINPLEGVVFSRQDFNDFKILYDLPKMVLAELQYYEKKMKEFSSDDLNKTKSDALDLLSRIEEVCVSVPDAHASYEKLWKENESKNFVEKAVELLRDYGSNYFLRLRWNLSHRQEVKLFIETCSVNEKPVDFLYRLLENQDTENPHGSLSRRIHFIMKKAMEELDLFPNVYACRERLSEDLSAKL